MQIVINIKRWHIILICSILVLGFTGICLVLAQNQPVVGHSISEISGGVFDQPIRLASGSYLAVQGSGDEQVYIGGDGVAGDVQLGSFNPNIQKVALWNAGSGNLMDLYSRDIHAQNLNVDNNLNVKNLYAQNLKIITDLNDCKTGDPRMLGKCSCPSGYALVQIWTSGVGGSCKCCRLKIAY